MDFDAIILAAGRGKRLRPFTDSRPKSLLYLPGGTLLDQQLRLLAELAPRRVIVVTGHLAPVIEGHLALSRAAAAVPIETVRQARPEGLLNALLDALSGVEPPLLVIHGDSYLAGSLAGFAPLIAAGETGIAARRDDDGTSPATKDLVSITPPDRILAFGRRVAGAETANSFGCYLLGRDLPALMREIGERGIADVDMIPVFREFLRGGGLIHAMPWEGLHYNLNREDDVLRASRETLRKWPELASSHAESGAWIPPGESREMDGARITGPSWIGEGAEIDGAVIGPDAAVGAGASIAGARVARALVYPGARVTEHMIDGRMIG